MRIDDFNAVISFSREEYRFGRRAGKEEIREHIYLPYLAEKARFMMTLAERLGDFSIFKFAGVKSTQPFAFEDGAGKGFVVYHAHRSGDYSGSARFTFIWTPLGERFLVVHSDHYSYSYNPSHSEEIVVLYQAEQEFVANPESPRISPTIET